MLGTRSTTEKTTGNVDASAGEIIGMGMVYIKRFTIPIGAGLMVCLSKSNPDKNERDTFFKD